MGIQINETPECPSHDIVSAFLRQVKGEIVDLMISFLPVHLLRRQLGVLRVDGSSDFADEVVDADVVAGGNGDGGVNFDDRLGDDLRIHFIDAFGESVFDIPHLLEYLVDVIRVHVVVDLVEAQETASMR